MSYNAAAAFQCCAMRVATMESPFHSKQGRGNGIIPQLQCGGAGREPAGATQGRTPRGGGFDGRKGVG